MHASKGCTLSRGTSQNILSTRTLPDSRAAEVRSYPHALETGALMDARQIVSYCSMLECINMKGWLHLCVHIEISRSKTLSLFRQAKRHKPTATSVMYPLTITVDVHSHMHGWYMGTKVCLSPFPFRAYKSRASSKKKPLQRKYSLENLYETHDTHLRCTGNGKILLHLAVMKNPTLPSSALVKRIKLSALLSDLRQKKTSFLSEDMCFQSRRTCDPFATKCLDRIEDQSSNISRVY